MCTINSLGKGCHLTSIIPSLRTVLILLSLCVNQDSSGAPMTINTSMAITVTAPPDITVNIQRTGGCDTIINMPPAGIADPCNGPKSVTTYSVFNSLNTNGGNMYFTTGIFKVYYLVTDTCGMTGIDSTQVSVFDSDEPNVICNPQMTMNLPSYGYLDAPSWIFDAGSFDSCGHVFFKVRRMNANANCISPGNPNNLFDDQVRFCCDDVDSSFIRIILRVYDIYPGSGPVNDTLLQGRFVDCMVQAIVEDKIAPDIDCPSNLTINCGDDLDSVFAVTPVAVISDNCSIPGDTIIINANLDACGSGVIQRTFIATDRQGQISSCTQTITVLKVNTFDGLDPSQLKWPAHKIVFACRIDPDTIDAGIPEINEDACAYVVTSHRDEEYSFDRGGVCAKVLRYWEVIDWCKYNPGLFPNPRIPSNGYYNYIQEIKIMDTLAPVFSGLNDTIIGIQSASCQPGTVILPDIHVDDCGSISNIAVNYEVDFYNDGQIDISGVGLNASGLYPLGRHLVRFTAFDSCHNTGVYEFILEVIDVKPPNANAIFGLSSSVIPMQAGPMVSINAKLFNQKSTDNCTSENELRFSFSSDINDTLRVYNCDSLGLRIIHLTVWDLAGNSSEVITYVLIDDVHNICPPTLKGSRVSGQILTVNNQVVRDVKINLSYDNIDIQGISDYNGYYNFNSIPKNSLVKLKPSHNKNFGDGISTADILKIQRHILGLEPLSNPIDLFAADVDANQKITAKDIVWLRKLILGVITEIPNQDSYVFMHKNYLFSIPENPFPERDSCKQIYIETKSDVNIADILGIKLGDVNHSFKSGLQIENQTDFNLTYRVTNGILEILPGKRGLINGFQFELINSDLCLEPWTKVFSNLDNWSDENYTIQNNVIRITYSQVQAFAVDPKNPILSIPIGFLNINCLPFIKLGVKFQNEVYSKDEIFDINSLDPVSLNKSNDPESIEVIPNPFKDNFKLLIKSNAENTTQVDIYGVDGKKIFGKIFQLQQGENNLEFNSEILPGNGIYMLAVKSNQFSGIFKIINE